MEVLIEFEKKPLLFSHPKDIIRCFHPAEIPECFEKIEGALKKGHYVAGFLSYEAGYAFEEKLLVDKDYDFPLLQMGCYEKIGTDPSGSVPIFSRLLRRNTAPRNDTILNFRGGRTYPCASDINDLSLNISKPDYDQNISRIRHHIALGDVYQITYCIKNRFSIEGSPYGLYRRLLRRQPVPYPAYLKTDGFEILSLSPEMFLKKRGHFITTKPMKGTWPRGGAWSDLFAGLCLKFDPKNRAENVMIADLLRNDLGRVGLNIKAPRLFEVRQYATLYQMTSTVTAHIDKDIPIYRLFKSVFPSGSVTGAPKIRAMEIIREIEREERKIYTGMIGWIAPNKDLCFNIPIRTLLIEAGRGEMGVGGGIVWDSTADGEWAEGILKASFLKTVNGLRGTGQFGNGYGNEARIGNGKGNGKDHNL